MQLIEKAQVITSDGILAGHITHVVLDPATKKVTHIVVRVGTLVSTDKVIPMTLVETCTPEQVTLRIGEKALQTLPDFEEACYIPVDIPEPNELSALAGIMGGWLYFYPPPELPLQHHEPADHPYHMTHRFVESTLQNIPEGEIALKEGASVISADFHTVGHVESILVSPDTGCVTHMLISKGILFKAHKLIPVAWINIVGESEVHLNVDSEVIKRLPDYS